MMKLIKAVYDSWGAEVVFVTSNFQGNREVMEGCKEAGIPVFVRLIYSTDFLPSFSYSGSRPGHALGFLIYCPRHNHK
jgi:hypothetical protein